MLSANKLFFGVLGPVTVYRDGRRLEVGFPKQRAALALLLTRANQVITADELVDELWPHRPPRSALANAQMYVANLRRQFAADPEVSIARTGASYVLTTPTEAIDMFRFRSLVRQGREALAGQRPAAALLEQALALWRGPPLADIAMGPALTVVREDLENERLAAMETLAEARLAVGSSDGAEALLREILAADPLRERAHARLMEARYNAGDTAGALVAFADARRVLLAELGVEPGEELRRLHAAMLDREPGLSQIRAPGEPMLALAQLPADVAAFTGREWYLRRLDALLTGTGESAATIAAITGMAGIGKTALAVHWAHRVRHRFPDGQLHVDLHGHDRVAPLRPIQALAQLLGALGVPANQVPVEPQQAAALYRSRLADRRLLVLLDNAHSAEQVRPLLPGGPACRVLVTSRNTLGGLVARDGAHRLALDALDATEADAMLTRLLGAEVAGEPAAEELARLCAFLPLAIRIAAANLTAGPHQGIAGYVDDLRAGNRLAALAIDNDEHTAVRATFDLSYAALPPPARRMFRLLGLVAGPDISVPAAAALADLPARDAKAGLDLLADAHLIDEHVTGRYRLHDLLRDYAAELARDEGESGSGEAVSRLLGHYLDAVDAAGRLLYPQLTRLPSPNPAGRTPAVSFADEAHAAAWLESERPNLVSAVVDAAEHGPRVLAWRLADALRGHFWMRLHTVDWLAVARAGLAAARADGELPAQTAAHINLATLHLRQGQHRAAIRHLDLAAALGHRAGWTEGQAAALGNLAMVNAQHGRLEHAVGYLERSRALSERVGLRDRQAVNLDNLGTVLRDMGRLDQALDRHQQALARCGSIGSGTEATVLTNLGRTLYLLGQTDRAIDRLDQAVTLSRQGGDRCVECEALCWLATIRGDLGQYASAHRLVGTALSLARDTGHGQSEALALNTTAAIEHRLGHHRRALEHHRQALTLARNASSRELEVIALIGLATVHRELDDLSSALAHARQALTISRRAGYRILEGQAMTELAAASQLAGHIGTAAEHAEQALAIHRETGYRGGLVRARSILEGRGEVCTDRC